MGTSWTAGRKEDGLGRLFCCVANDMQVKHDSLARNAPRQWFNIKNVNGQRSEVPE